MAKKGKAKKRKKTGGKKVRETMHDIYLAGLGAVASIGEGGAKVAQEAVVRGKQLAKAGKKKGLAQAESNLEAFGSWVDARVQRVLERIGAPSKEEVAAIASRLDLLIEKVANLEAAAAKPGARKPAARKPAARKPAARKPAAEAATRPAAKTKTAAKKPAARKPAARKPATRKPAARKPAAKPPAAKKPAARKPAAKKPAAKRPTSRRTTKPATR